MDDLNNSKLDEMNLDYENMTMDQIIRAAIIASAINSAHETMPKKEEEKNE